MLLLLLCGLYKRFSGIKGVSPPIGFDQENGEMSQSGEPAQNPSGGNRNGQRRQSSLMDGGRESNGGAGGNNAPGKPLTGEEFGEWSDQLRDIEEMLEDPELRNRVAQVRDRARAMRSEFKRHGEMPQWDLVKSQLLGEMQLLQQRMRRAAETNARSVRRISDCLLLKWC